MRKLFLLVFFISAGPISWAQWNLNGSILENVNVGDVVINQSSNLRLYGRLVTYFPKSNAVLGGEFLGTNGYWGFRTDTDNRFNIDVYNFNNPKSAFSIDQTGNVGIATTTPEAKLHVAGNSILGNTFDTWTSFGASNGGRIRGSGEGYLLLASNPSGSGDRNIYYQVHGGYNHVMLGGNLGIGEQAPQAKLTVLENSGLGTGIGNHKLLSRFSVTGNVNHFMINEWLYRDANGADWVTARAHNGISIDASFLTPGVDTRTWWERDPYNNIQSWGDGGQTFMTINQGNVGIGTTNPDAKLAVKGTIHAEEVKVDLQVPGPDYVFEPTYQLPSLTEIENYIKANKHLPEVPSAKEMETNGINLSEMNMLLLKKVEELTLHLIRIEKENELQRKEINELKSKGKR